MIVDDDELNNYITSKIIEHAGLTDHIESYSSPEKALAYLVRNSTLEDGDYPEVLLLDLSMYGMNGWQFLDELKNLPEAYLDKINIFILTNSILESDMLKAEKHPFVKGFFHKPLTMPMIQEIHGIIFESGNTFRQGFKVLLSLFY